MMTGAGEVKHGLEASVYLAGAQSDAFEFLGIAEETLDEVAPPVRVNIDWNGFGASRVL